jgi:hypothetical protein
MLKFLDGNKLNYEFNIYTSEAIFKPNDLVKILEPNLLDKLERLHVTRSVRIINIKFNIIIEPSILRHTLNDRLQERSVRTTNTI